LRRVFGAALRDVLPGRVHGGRVHGRGSGHVLLRWVVPPDWLAGGLLAAYSRPPPRAGAFPTPGLVHHNPDPLLVPTHDKVEPAAFPARSDPAARLAAPSARFHSQRGRYGGRAAAFAVKPCPSRSKPSPDPRAPARTPFCPKSFAGSASPCGTSSRT